MSRNIIVEVPYNEASHLRDEWEQRLIGLQEDAAQLEKAIAAIDAQLSGQLPLPQSVSIPASSIKSNKRKKGENLRTIKAYLDRVGATGATAADISKKTNLHISSCNAVLKRHSDIFAKSTKDGLWRCRPNDEVKIKSAA
jgi:conjugal transfer/entry exclusion protein